MINTDWLKYINNLDKEFYNRFADLCIKNLYDMENEIKNSTIKYQNKVRDICKNNKEQVINSENLIINEIDNVLKPVEDRHKDYINKLTYIYDGYIEELTGLVILEANSRCFSMIKRRAFLSENKYKKMLHEIIKESRDLINDFINNLSLLIDYYFETIKDKDEINEIPFETAQIVILSEQMVNNTKIKYEKIFKQKDIIKYLESNGFTYKDTGRHANYSNGINKIPIPVHGSKDFGFGLQRKVQKEVIKFNS